MEVMKRFFRKKTNSFLHSEDEFINLFEVARENISTEIVKFEKETNFFVEKEFIDSLALLTQISIKKSTLDYNHGRLLYSLLCETLENYRADEKFKILEIGTAKGFSSILMSKCLIEMQKEGFIITIDILGHEVQTHWNSIRNADGKLTSRKEILKDYKLFLENIIFIEGKSPEILKTIFMGRINFAFIDGQHDLKSVQSEIEYVSKYQESGDIIVFDDYTPGSFDGVVQAVDQLEKSTRYVIRRIHSSPERGYAIASRK